MSWCSHEEANVESGFSNSSPESEGDQCILEYIHYTSINLSIVDMTHHVTKTTPVFNIPTVLGESIRVALNGVIPNQLLQLAQLRI